MARRYMDFFLTPRGVSEAAEMVRRSVDLGFSAIVLECSDDCWKEVRREAGKVGLEVYRRMTLRIEDKVRLYRELSKLRWKYDVLVVDTVSRDVALAALRDRRVDALVVSRKHSVVLDRHLLHVANNPVEIILSDLMHSLDEVMDKLIKFSKFLRKDKLDFITSSGASDPLSMRAPRQLASITLALNIDPAKCLDSVSSTPYSIASSNHARIIGMVEPMGVWAFEGEDGRED